MVDDFSHKSNIKLPKGKKKRSLCGAQDRSLNLHHIIPFSEGGTNSPENLILVCSNCHSSIGFNIKEVDFVLFLSELLAKSDQYLLLQHGKRIFDTNYIVDMHAEEYNVDSKREIFIEVRSEPSFTEVRFEDIYNRLKQLRHLSPSISLVFSFPGEFTEKQAKKIRQLGVEVWDKQFIKKRFSSELEKIDSMFASILLQIKIGRTLPIERQYIESLKKIIPGKSEAHKYQRLVHEILQILFVPPLGSPLYESSDQSKTNRRDHILSNFVEEGYWAYLRDKYTADYIVIDSKNYSGPVTKHCVLQVANYLKLKGLGLFGMIIARNDGDRGCMQTIQEKWLMENKMIVILTDEDVENMLIAKSNSSAPEEVIRQKIDDFRVSI